MSGQYTDEERVYIAKKQYENLKKNDKILTEDQEKLVGYVSEIKHKLSGENTYILTDVKLPDNPTFDDLAKVGQVTLLYQGSQDVLDWTLNNVPMTARVLVPDWVPTRPTIQLRDAAKTLQETLEKYPNAAISIYGHSLGSMNAQNAISSVEAKYDHRISGVYLYNGPNIYKTMSDRQRLNADRLHHKIYNYVDTKDFIGLGYDNTQSVGQLFKINSISVNGFINQHNWGGYLYDEDGNLVHANGALVSPETRIKKVDINDDGIVDLVVEDIDNRPRNLLSSDQMIITNSQEISVNLDILNTLALNLSIKIDEDIAQIKTICQLCIEKNDQINKDFESRKQQMSESIKEVFQSAGFPFLLHQLNNSIDDIMTHQSVLEQGMMYTQMEYPFSSHQTPLINGNPLQLSICNIQLANLSRVCQPLVTQIKQEKTHTISSFFTGEQTLLGSWQIIESATNHLIRKSDVIFEGEGLRLGKKDGISDALTEVLKTIRDNTDEIAQSLLNTVAFIRDIAINFQQADEWLGTQLQNGRLIGETSSPSVAPNYIAYLERNPLLDDVKDVLQAFDRQVEQKSRQYAREVANVYSTSMGTFEQGLNRWKNLSEDLEEIVSQIVSNYDQAIYVKEEKIMHKQIGEDRIKETTYPIHYWGTLEQLYPSDVRDVIHQMKHQILPKKDIIQQAIWQSERVKNQLQNLESTLKPIIEEGVYRAFDLDEIVKGQKVILQLARRLSQEIGHVAQVITGEGMTSHSIETLQNKLQDTQRLIGYYAKFVGDCFGDNEMSGVHTMPSTATRFSLNSPIANK